jgi:hypothetical protein
MRIFILSIITSLLFITCKNQPTQASLTGKYTISAKLKDSQELKEEINKNVSDVMKNVKIDIEKAKDEMNNDLDGTNIDTTTPEGNRIWGQGFWQNNS